MELVGVAVNGAEAVELVRQHHPDVILLDLVMPKNGWAGGHPGHSSGRPVGEDSGIDQFRG